MLLLLVSLLLARSGLDRPTERVVFEEHAPFLEPATMAGQPRPCEKQRRLLSTSATATMEGVQTNPIVIVVTVTIDAAREAEFLAAMTVDAVGSRKEPGCRQFDVIKVENTYMFYEVYDNAEAVVFHKAQDHFKDWAAFEASGGVKDITVVFGGGVEGSEALMTPK
eukprot:gene18370-12998_t